MKASVIIPSYNSCERLYLNLVSLNYQDCRPGEFEVIVVDNGSWDDTSKMISNFNAGFEIKYLRMESNKGRAQARNIGAAYSKGEILIFNDSDMINASDFVNSHIKEHMRKKLIVCGYGWRRIYSYYYKDFKGYLKTNFLKQMKNYDVRGRNFLNRNTYRLISEQDIENDKFLKYSFFLENRQKSINEVIKGFGYDMSGYCFPWRFFMTNNCSLESSAFDEAGGFDENFIAWGCEDIDMGYRLYKKGYNFRLAPDCISAHQEHPVDMSDICNDNIGYFLDKHDSIDLYLFYYGKICTMDIMKLNEIAKEVEQLKKSGEYEDLLGNFLAMLKMIRTSCIYVKSSSNIRAREEGNKLNGFDASAFETAYKYLQKETSSIKK